MDDKGKIVKREQLATSRQEVRRSLGRYRQPLKAVLEASYSWGPMYDWLDEITDEVIRERSEPLLKPGSRPTR